MIPTSSLTIMFLMYTVNVKQSYSSIVLIYVCLKLTVILFMILSHFNQLLLFYPFED